jgi:hypothetical protein
MAPGTLDVELQTSERIVCPGVRPRQVLTETLCSTASSVSLTLVRWNKDRNTDFPCCAAVA